MPSHVAAVSLSLVAPGAEAETLSTSTSPKGKSGSAKSAPGAVREMLKACPARKATG